MLATLSLIESKANNVLPCHHNTPGVQPPCVGNNKTRRLLNHQPGYHKQKQKSINIEWKCAYRPVLVQEFFGKLDDTLKTYGINPRDSYNTNESVFIVQMAKDQTVAINDFTRPSYIASTTNNDDVLVVE
jgi:hypothetical protein